MTCAECEDDLQHYCTVCGEVWTDYYDAVSHVHTVHDVCGTPPEAHVETRPAQGGDEA